MSVFFTADTHFGHTNVLKYTKRPYTTVEEMDEALVQNWNATVKPCDLIYHVGDVALCKPARAYELVKRLNGTKHLIAGNHDKALLRDKDLMALFASVKDMADIRVTDLARAEGYTRIVLCHFAMRVWNRSHHGAWQLYGHSHGSLPDDPNALSLDVGVDCWNMAPVSYEKLAEVMAKKKENWKPVDHHKGNNHG